MRQVGVAQVSAHEVSSITGAAGGRTVVGGTFSGTGEDFGSGITLSSPRPAFFVASYGPTGAVEWVQSLTPTAGSAHITRMAEGPEGSVFVSGAVLGAGAQLVFPNGQSVPGPSNNQSQNSFVARFESDGGIAWVHTNIGSTHCDTTALTASASTDRVFEAGNYSGSATFSSGLSLSPGNSDVWAAIGSSDGGTTARMSALQCGSGNQAIALKSALVEDAGTAYIVGWLLNSCQYTPAVGPSVTVTGRPAAAFTVILVKISTGSPMTVEWAQPFAGWAQSISDQPIAVLTIGSRVYIAGAFSGSILDAGQLDSAGGLDVALMRIEPLTGGVLGSATFGGAGDEVVREMVPMADGGGFWVLGDRSATPGLLFTQDGGHRTPFIAAFDLGLTLIETQGFAADGHARGQALGTSRHDGALRVAGTLSKSMQSQLDVPLDGGGPTVFNRRSGAPHDLFFGKLGPR